MQKLKLEKSIQDTELCLERTKSSMWAPLPLYETTQRAVVKDNQKSHVDPGGHKKLRGKMAFSEKTTNHDDKTEWGINLLNIYRPWKQEEWLAIPQERNCKEK